MLIENGKISHNPTLGCFTIIGTRGNGHVVKLHPKESCSCPSSSTCYHILAVKISIGVDVQTKKVKVNLSQLRRNTRSRREKKSGRKAPRPGIFIIIIVIIYVFNLEVNQWAIKISYFLHYLGDYDIMPAPDSFLSQSISHDPTTGVYCLFYRCICICILP